MANWRRDFFRLWVLASVLWVGLIGFLDWPAFNSPYTPVASFTYDPNGVIERLHIGSPRYVQVTDDFVLGWYTMVKFDGALETITFFAPNIATVSVEGKEYEARYNNHSPSKRSALVTAIAKLVERDHPGLSSLEAHQLVQQAAPQEVKSKYQAPWVKYESLEYATRLAQIATNEQRASSLTSLAGYALIPPIVLLILGGALGWVLSGFRRLRFRVTRDKNETSPEGLVI